MVCKPKFILTLSIYHHIQLVTEIAIKTKQKAHAEKQKPNWPWEVLLLCLVFSTKQKLLLYHSVFHAWRPLLLARLMALVSVLV